MKNSNRDAISVLVFWRGRPEKQPPEKQFARCILVWGATRCTAAMSQRPQREGDSAGGLVKRPPLGRHELAAQQRGSWHEDLVQERTWGRKGEASEHRSRDHSTAVFPHSLSTLARQNLDVNLTPPAILKVVQNTKTGRNPNSHFKRHPGIFKLKLYLLLELPASPLFVQMRK